MNLQQLANEHREAIATGETSLDFWSWIAATTGAKGKSALEIEAALAGVNLDSEPEPGHVEAIADDGNDLLVRSALNHWLWPEYEAACRKAGLDASADPVAFWDWVSSPASAKGDGGSLSSHAADFRPNQRGAMSVDEIVQAVAAEERMAQRVKSGGDSYAPNQRGALSADEIMRAVNAEAKRA